MQKNIVDGGYRPCILVKKGKTGFASHRVEILDDAGNVVAVIVQPKDQQLSCGARIWIETYASVRMVTAMDAPAHAIAAEQVITL